MRPVRLLSFAHCLCVFTATGCSNSESEISKLKSDLAKVQAQLDAASKQLETAAKEAKAPPKWEYKMVEGVISHERLAALGEEGWEWFPIPFAPAIVHATNVDPKTGNVENTRVEFFTGQKVAVNAPTNVVYWFKRRKG